MLARDSIFSGRQLGTSAGYVGNHRVVGRDEWQEPLGRTDNHDQVEFESDRR